MIRSVGFTLIELVIVTAIVAMIVAIVLPFVAAISEGHSNANSIPVRSFSVPRKFGGFTTESVPNVVTIDNCEYFYLPVAGYPGYTLTHKGDCSTCRDVTAATIKEALNAGKAEATDTR